MEQQDQGKGKSIAISKTKIKPYNKLVSFKNQIVGTRLRTLEAAIDIDKQINLISQTKEDLIPGELLYTYGHPLDKTRFFQHYDELTIACGNDNIQITLDFMTNEGYRKLLESRYKFIYIGLIAIGLKALHRKDLGTKTSLVLLDSSHNQINAGTIGLMEIDMNTQNNIAYMATDLFLPIEDFHKYIKLLVKTLGYDMVANRENLLLTKNLIGHLSNTSKSGFKYDINSVLHYLVSKGISLLPAPSYDSTLHTGELWNFVLPRPSTLTPKAIHTYLERNNSLSVRFSNYVSNPSTSHQDSDSD